MVSEQDYPKLLQEKGLDYYHFKQMTKDAYLTAFDKIKLCRQLLKRIDFELEKTNMNNEADLAKIRTLLANSDLLEITLDQVIKNFN